ncbi:TetR/AcrR family transcriptional regulator [Bacillus sp. FJAT-42376]|uniref:TetR/AcrR family transcriptional regulator n=1 Tax=Bacillus sp. FJAT-42376 TaxID=2014076 RepID=UPI000F4E36EC|nr:TetR/AcrR family transcriptional regulator [Bacillus sp. FJAT-42376]AZB44684.1 TetR/AcrR family transcriptional regulator [Bacillus sp. FJAT-42376]
MAARKAVKQELTRDIIMDAARELFTAEGYQNVSMRKIAKELGYSHGSIYYHFNSKAELFYAMVRSDFQLLDDVLNRIVDREQASDEEKLKSILFGYIEFGLTHQSHYEVMFLIKDEEVKSYFAQEPNISYEKFAQSLYNLTDGKVTVSEIWSVFLSLHGFVTHYSKTGMKFEDTKEMAERHVQFLMQTLIKK